jgi:hypothetical protein
MKKEDKKYYCLPDGTLREIPSDIYVPIKPRPENYGANQDLFELYTSQYKKEMTWFEAALSNQPAIYTDEKFPVGLVEGELTVKKRFDYKGGNYYGKCCVCNGQFIGDKRDRACKECSEKTLFATRKREEVNTEKHTDREIQASEEELKDAALQRYCSPYGKAIPETYAWINGFKAAQERQGEESEDEWGNIWNIVNNLSKEDFIILASKSFTIKKKQQ